MLGSWGCQNPGDQHSVLWLKSQPAVIAPLTCCLGYASCVDTVFGPFNTCSFKKSTRSSRNFHTDWRLKWNGNTYLCLLPQRANTRQFTAPPLLPSQNLICKYVESKTDICTVPKKAQIEWEARDCLPLCICVCEHPSCWGIYLPPCVFSLTLYVFVQPLNMDEAALLCLQCRAL